MYKEAIQIRKQSKVIKKSDGPTASSSRMENEDSPVIEGKLATNANDVEVKYKLHICYLNTNQVSGIFYAGYICH